MRQFHLLLETGRFQPRFTPAANAVLRSGILRLCLRRRLSGKGDYAETGGIVIQAQLEKSMRTRYIGKMRRSVMKKRSSKSNNPAPGLRLSSATRISAGFSMPCRGSTACWKRACCRRASGRLSAFSVRGYIEGSRAAGSFEQKKEMLASRPRSG